MEIKLLATRHITATVELLSGVHIGAGKDAVEIGGLDLPVVKNPFTQEPYIPGSSVKGKLRSLLEWSLECIESDGSVWGSDSKKSYQADDVILRSFGTTHKEWQGGPTRLIVRDAALDPEWVRTVRDQGLALTEEKMEVSIDRIQGKAKKSAIRRTERVPAGARFKLEMIYKVFDTGGDNGKVDQTGLNRVLEALKLLEKDALGGSGSRGYGRVRIQNLQVDGADIQGDFDGIERIDAKQPNELVGANHG